MRRRAEDTQGRKSWLSSRAKIGSPGRRRTQPDRSVVQSAAIVILAWFTSRRSALYGRSKSLKITYKKGRGALSGRCLTTPFGKVMLRDGCRRHHQGLPSWRGRRHAPGSQVVSAEGTDLQTPLRFEVLGPVRAWRGATEVDLGPPQQRLVLAVLVLAESTPVPVSRLLETVWGDAPPASATGILRTYVHGLRKALDVRDGGQSIIRSGSDAYELQASPDQIDISSFRRLTAEAEWARRRGDMEDACQHFQDALKLWKGAALAGVAGLYAQAQRNQLEELRLTAQVGHIRSEIDTGGHEQATTDLKGLVTEHPLDERFRELLMLALYRSGRQSAALATFREAQTLLRNEVGIDPGPSLQSMYQRILQADESLLAPRPIPKPAPAEASFGRQGIPYLIPAHLPADLPAFVGREAELTRLTRLTSEEALKVVAITGTAGVGKSTFAIHWAWRITSLFPDGNLYLNLRGFDPVGAPLSAEQALCTLLESLGMDVRGLQQNIDVLMALYRTVLSGKRILLLLDNARDAAQVRPLLPGASDCIAIVTSRSRLIGLVAADAAYPLHLSTLSTSEAGALLARRIGKERITAEAKAVEEIISRCSRLPLALALMAARAATMPNLPLASITAELGDTTAGLDAFNNMDVGADIRAVFSWSYRALSPPSARLFRLLALHPGPDVSLTGVASLLGTPLSHTKRALLQLIQAHLLDEVTPGRFSSHDLLRTYATELTKKIDSSQEIRAARHRMLDHYLHSARAATALTSRASAPISLAPVAEGVCAEQFDDSTAQAAAWFIAEHQVLLDVLAQAAAHEYDIHTWQLTWALSKYLCLRGMWHEQESANHVALEATLRLGDLEAQAHIHQGLAVAKSGLGHHEAARSHARQALELLNKVGNARTLAEGYLQLSWVAERQGDSTAALESAQQSLAIQRRCEYDSSDESCSRYATAAALNAVGRCFTLLGKGEQALKYCRQALAVQQNLEDGIDLAQIWNSIGLAHYALGKYDDAVASFQTALSILRRHDGNSWLIADILKRTGDAYLGGNQVKAARAAWTESLDVMERFGQANTEAIRARLLQYDEPSD